MASGQTEGKQPLVAAWIRQADKGEEEITKVREISGITSWINFFAAILKNIISELTYSE